MSARQFAQQHGIDTTRLSAPLTKKPSRNRCKGLSARRHHRKAQPPTPKTQHFRRYGSPAASHLPRLRRPVARFTRFGSRTTRTPAPAAPAPAGPEPTIWSSSAAVPCGTSAHGRRHPAGPGGSIGQPAMNAPLPTNTLPTTAPANAFGQAPLIGRTTAQRLHARLRPRLEPRGTHIGCTQQCAAGDRPGPAASARSTCGVGRPGFDGAGNCACC